MLPIPHFKLADWIKSKVNTPIIPREASSLQTSREILCVKLRREMLRLASASHRDLETGGGGGEAEDGVRPTLEMHDEYELQV